MPVALDDGQIGADGDLRPAPALFPVLKRPHIEAEQSGEVRLRWPFGCSSALIRSSHYCLPSPSPAGRRRSTFITTASALCRPSCASVVSGS